ncbi:MAG TPA: hypothetical protein VE442_05630 [Jatrophihabitans sp.]|nr:hypothetical protein [Jatrophihabitans sp.]
MTVRESRNHSVKPNGATRSPVAAVLRHLAANAVPNGIAEAAVKYPLVVLPTSCVLIATPGTA